MFESLVSNSSSKKTTTLSLRINSALYGKLKDECDEKAISINSLVISMIQKHIVWEVFVNELGFTPISKRTMNLLFEEIPPEKLAEIARGMGFDIMKELILLMFGKINFKTIVELIKIRGTIQGMVNHRISNDNEHFITIHHGINKKYSEFLSEIFQKITEDNNILFKKLNSQSKILSFSLKEI